MKLTPGKKMRLPGWQESFVRLEDCNGSIFDKHGDALSLLPSRVNWYTRDDWEEVDAVKPTLAEAAIRADEREKWWSLCEVRAETQAQSARDDAKYGLYHLAQSHRDREQELRELAALLKKGAPL